MNTALQMKMRPTSIILVGAILSAGLTARAVDINQTVTQTSGQNWAVTASWGTPAAVPLPGTNYITPNTFSVRTPDQSAPSTFPGDKLTINSGGTLQIKNGNGAASANLVLNGGSIKHNTGNGNGSTLTNSPIAGTLLVAADSLIGAFGGGGTKSIWVQSAVSGTGNLKIDMLFTTNVLSLSGNNSGYSGNWTNLTGRMEIWSGTTAPLGSGSVTLVNPDNSLTFNSTNDLVINNVISGLGFVRKQNSGTVVLGANNNFTGALTNQAGTLVLTGSGTQSYTMVQSNGILRVANSAALPSGFTLRVDSYNTHTGRLELSNNVTIATGLPVELGMRNNLTPAIENISGNNTISDPISISTGGGLPSRIQVDAGTTLALNGSISSGVTGTRSVGLTGDGNGVVSSTIDTGLADNFSVLKDGPGTWTLNGANSYNGNTVISNGVLKLGASASIASSAAIQISAGATLDSVLVPGGLALNYNQVLRGSGTVLGNVTTSPGAAIEVGLTNQYGTLAFNNNLILAGSETLRFDVASGTNDLLNVTGSLTLNGTTEIQIAVPAGFANNGSYRLINYSGTLQGGGSFSVTPPASRQIFTIDTATAGQVNLVVSGSPTDLVWSGDGAGNVWDVGSSANWNGQVFYQADNVTFNDAGSATPDINITTAVLPGSVTVSNTAQPYTFTGSGVTTSSTLTKRGGNVLALANVGNNFSGPINIEAGTLAIGNGGSTGDLGTGNIVNNGEFALNKSSSGNLITGNISGSGTVRVTGGGAALTLAGTNTYAGLTTIETGCQLSLFNNSALGSTNAGTVVQSGGSVRFTSLGNWTSAEPLEINGYGLASSAGALYANTVNNKVLWTGPITLGSDSQIRLANAQVTMTLANTVLGNQTALQCSPTDVTSLLTFSNTLSIGNAATLTKDGSGTVVLAGNSNLCGSTVINGGKLLIVTTNTPNIGDVTVNTGTLQVGDGGANGALPTGLISVAGAGTTLLFNSSNNFALNQDMTGAGGLTKQGAGTLVLKTNSFTGNLLAQDGLLVLSGSGAQNLTRVDNNGVLRVANSAALPAGYLVRVNTYDTFTGRLELSNNVTIATGIPIELGMRGNASPALENVGGNNTINDTIAVSTGGITPARIQVDAGTTLTLAGGINSGATGTRMLGLQGSGSGLVSGTIDNGAATSLSVTKEGSGTWTISSANTYSGSTVIQGGTLALAAGATIANTPSIQLLSNAVLNVAALAGGFTLDGAQTLKGEGTIQGNVLANGTVTPGANLGTLNFANNLTLAGSTVMELNRSAAQNADLIAAGAINFGGVLTVTNVGVDLQGGDVFNLFDGPISGTFAATNLPALSSTNLSWDLSLLQSQGVIKVASNVAPQPTILPPTLSGTNLTVQVASEAGFNYVLQATPALSPATWTDIQTNAGGGTLTFSIPVTPGNPQRFFRINVR
ncbi:MAG: beta strand repeat-containing protein [Verrucomicrobiota bacterium]